MTVTMDFQKYPSMMARTVVQQVNFHVEGMVGDSVLIDNKWLETDEKFGIFDRDELKLGKLLGSGGFSHVYEVLSFDFSDVGNSMFSSSQVEARKLYKNKPLGNSGKSKYVVKHLKAELMEEFSLFCISACDLVLEAQYLSRLDHENILKIHGWSYGGTRSFSNGKHDDYFLVLERLHETLESRIKDWKTNGLSTSAKPSTYDCREILGRTNVALGIASALQYLHGKNIVFRDLKPDNIGFDENGTVKIFDFGLARELPAKFVSINDVFEMSGRIGTVRYMAPEVLLGQRYNQKADTYSWSMLYWICLTLDLPYGEMTRSDHSTLVCQQGQRPNLCDRIWPDSISDLLENAWAQNVRYRLSMTEVCSCLKNVESDLRLEIENCISP